jgi:ADP-ribosylation factor GTPase-activating protein 2/3
VHTTFVRSVDLDEWTQRQIDAMRLGGNGNARQFFRQHGLTDMHGKIEKKYTSTAAVAYKAELAKQVEAAAAQRGEAVSSDVSTSTVGEAGSLLENLALQQKLEAANARTEMQTIAKPVNTAQPKAVLASQNASARGKLVVTPPTSGNAPLLLRKPASSMSGAMMLKKKPSSGGGGLRINKLAVGGDTFDDIGKGEEQPAPTPAEPVVAVAVAPPPVPAPAPAPAPVPAPAPALSGVDKLKAMNTDFFSGI